MSEFSLIYLALLNQLCLFTPEEHLKLYWPSWPLNSLGLQGTFAGLRQNNERENETGWLLYLPFSVWVQYQWGIEDTIWLSCKRDVLNLKSGNTPLPTSIYTPQHIQPVFHLPPRMWWVSWVSCKQSLSAMKMLQISWGSEITVGDLVNLWWQERLNNIKFLSLYFCFCLVQRPQWNSFAWAAGPRVFLATPPVFQQCLQNNTSLLSFWTISARLSRCLDILRHSRWH